MASKPDQQQDGTEPSEAAGDEDGFGAAFSERAIDPAGQRASEAQEEDGEESPSSQEPADKAGSEQAPADKAATEEEPASGPKADAFDPWAGLTPEQKSHFERLQASERSNRGRVGALTKKLNTFTPSPAAPAAKDEAERKDTKEPKDETDANASDLDKRLQQVTDEYGDVVGPIAEVLAQVRADIANLKQAPQVQSEIEADAEVLTEAYTALEQVHPDYATVAADKNFAAWLGDQPGKVQELANSFDPREVSLALTLFKTERSAATAAQPSDDSDPGSKGGTATDEKRRRQLEGSRQVPGKGQTAAAGVPNDFGSAFKARAEAHER